MKRTFIRLLFLLLAPACYAQADEFDFETYLKKTFTASYRNIIRDDSLNSAMKRVLGESCVKRLKTIYNSNESLKSELLTGQIRDLKNYGIDSSFYHYTKAREFNNILESRTPDRLEAHANALRTKAYDKIFRFYRTENLESFLWESVHFVAEDPFSSRDYGSIRTKLELMPNCHVLQWDNSTEKEVMDEVVGRFKGLDEDCNTKSRISSTMFHNNLHFIIAEDSGVDLIEYLHFPQWFTLLTPRCIQQTEISQK